MNKQFLLLIAATLTGFSAIAQVQINRPIDLSGAGVNGKVTGIRDVSGATDAVSAEVVQAGKLVTAISVSGTDAIVLGFTPAITSSTLQAGLMVSFRAVGNNTGNVTLDVDGVGGSIPAKPLYKNVSTNLVANDIKNNQMVAVIYDGTNFQLLSRTEYPEVDGSISNEGALGVGAGSATSSVITTNTSGGTGVTINAGTNIGITETTSANGGDITVGLSGTVGTSNGGTGTSTAFTPGSVVFAGSGGVYSQNNAGYFWDNTNKFLGIGTNAPNARITFNSLNDATNGADGISWLTGSQPTVYAIHRTAGAWSAPDYQQLRLGWLTGIIMDPGTGYGKSYVDIKGDGLRVTSGKAGIGTTAPSQLLSVAGTIGVSEVGGTGQRLEISSTSTGAVIFQNDNSPIIFKTFTGTQEKMRITDDGSVGIGTTGPVEAFSVYKAKSGWQGRFSNNSDGAGSEVYLAHGGGYGMHIRGYNTSDANYTLQMYNNGYETNSFWNSGRVALGLQGNVGVGTLSPVAKLDVQGGDIRQGNLTTHVKTYGAGAGANPATHNILRQFHETANWGAGGALVEIFVHYFGTGVNDYASFYTNYGYPNASTSILTKAAFDGSTTYHPVLSWGTPTTISGTNSYCDLQLTVYYYTTVTVRITTGEPITTTPSGVQNNVMYLY